MKKIKLPLEMANGVMVRTLDELKENWDLEKVVEHFVTGKLVTWLNDRYYTDLAEKVENLPKDGDGGKLQQALCRVFEMPCEDVELDVDEIAERKRRQDLLRQYTSDDEVLNNVDKVAFNQEDLAYLLDDEIAEIYLFNNKFTIPLNVEGKKYIGIGDNAVAEIRSKKPVNFAERGIAFSNVKFDEKYAAIHKVVPEKPKFFQKAFKGDVAKCVVESHVPAHYNPDHSTAPGNDTVDKVFLLSVKEVKNYFETVKDRICMPFGYSANFAAGVFGVGSINSNGNYVTDDSIVVRLAMWVDLSKM